jgi:hypothetical protein
MAADPAAEPGLVARLAATVRSWLSSKRGVAAEAGALRTAHSRAQRKLEELTGRRAALTAVLGQDGGADSAYLAIAGKCFSLAADGYTYEACPFGTGAAKQEPGSTSLGTFAGWLPGAGPGSDRPSFHFTNGLACWNGPARSLTVEVECGAATALLKVEEPNRCEYLARMTTPAACEAAQAAALEEAARAAAEAVAEVHTEL